ncbi:MAG: hypothetical protein LUQ37_01950 [Methanoregulaceae archaeon]|nr:hypothetical protein [Methanoregulaceae archaeon]
MDSYRSDLCKQQWYRDDEYLVDNRAIVVVFPMPVIIMGTKPVGDFLRSCLSG